VVHALKVVFVELAQEEIARTSPKVNASRVSALTGLYRQDVAKILKDEQDYSEKPSGILWRVLGQWQNDKRFTTSRGKPRVLEYGNLDTEFADLVMSVSTDLNPGTILFELARAGLVEKTTQGKVKLIKRLSHFKGDREQLYALLADDLDSLTLAVEENLVGKNTVPNAHFRTEYDNILKSAVPQIRRYILKETKLFHLKLSEYLARYDADINPKEGEEAGGTVTLSSFSLTSTEETP